MKVAPEAAACMIEPAFFVPTRERLFRKQRLLRVLRVQILFSFSSGLPGEKRPNEYTHLAR
jgi:hypothetical protein